MKALLEVLEKLPDITILDVAHDNMKTEIQFQVDSTYWLSRLEYLTKACPSLLFVKRYLTREEKFGFRWAIIMLGNLELEQWEDLAAQFNFILFEMGISVKPKVVQKASVTPIKRPIVKTAAVVKKVEAPKVNVRHRKLYDEENNEVGEATLFPMPHLENELNKPGLGVGGAMLYKKGVGLHSLYGAKP